MRVASFVIDPPVLGENLGLQQDLKVLLVKKLVPESRSSANPSMRFARASLAR